MTTATQAAFARQIGYDKSRVTQLKHAGRIVMAPGGKLVDVEASLARIAETADPGRRDVAERHAAARAGAGRQPLPEPAALAAADPLTGLGPESGGRARAKAALMHFENNMLKLEMALRRGLRFERAAVNREAAGLGAMVRAGIERVIDQTAPRLAAARGEDDRCRILDTELRRLRWVIKREMPRALRRMHETTNSERSKA